jgi:hypothetical protein
MNILKALTIFSLIIFVFPFFQTCSDRRIIEDPMIKGNPLSHEISITGEVLYPKTDKEIKNLFDNFLQSKRNLTVTGFDLVLSQSWPIIIGLIINLLIVVFAFKEKLRTVKILTMINFVTFLSFPIILYYSQFLEDINQIKIGYYLSVFNLVFIFCLARNSAQLRLCAMAQEAGK